MSVLSSLYLHPVRGAGKGGRVKRSPGRHLAAGGNIRDGNINSCFAVVTWMHTCTFFYSHKFLSRSKKLMLTVFLAS
jgi:hypothetical protein